MSLFSRIANVFRTERLAKEIDEELQSHLAEAVEHGRDPDEARRAFGSVLRYREESRDSRLVGWLDALRADVVFGWRQLNKRKLTSAAAILSLALAIGACMAAFRLLDAMLLRPLPVAGAERLYVIAREGVDRQDNRRFVSDSCSYPLFREMRAALRGKGELIAVSYADRVDLTYGSDQEMEKARRQLVSGSMFSIFGLKPAVGRLLTEADDRTPSAHPQAVISYDYWTRRFGRDPKVVGRGFRIGNDLYEIVGVVENGFYGTEPGVMVDIYVPTMMRGAATLNYSSSFWLRPLLKLEPGVAIAPIQEKLQALYRVSEQERAKGFTNYPKHLLVGFPRDKIVIEPATAGISTLQRNYRQGLTILAVLVGLVLLIACANLANLMTARATSRTREMALRVSIGAGRGRLLQLVLVESAWIALLATMLGSLFASWAAPFVVSLINPPNDPARLHLPLDWRVLGFGVLLAFGATLLFGLLPALRVSRIRPAGALKGGEDPHAKGRLLHALIGVQVAFCFLVLFVSGLFFSTYRRLADQPTGFSSDRVLTLETVSGQPQPQSHWDEMVGHLRSVPGVETVALSEWPIMAQEMWNTFISTVNGGPPSEVLTFLFKVSPGWMDAMKIPLLDGRGFRAGDVYPRVAIVNEAFARQYFGGASPVGKWFEVPSGATTRQHFEIVGLARDARYDNMRRPIQPTAYLPIPSVDPEGVIQPRARGTFVVRTIAEDPMTLASALRSEVFRARPTFRVSNIRTQQELVERHTVRERLLALMAVFFAVVALVLAAVGLFGVLDYSVLQRRREIGIRLAIGAPAAAVVRSVTVPALLMVVAGAGVGLLLGRTAERYLETLLYGVKASDPAMLAIPALALAASALLAALPPALRAVRTDPVQILRSE